MSARTLPLNDRLRRYMLGVSLREADVLRRLRDETARLAEAGMQISPEQGQFMAFLVQAIGARKVLEIGTFTGYSSLVVALALPSTARIVCCDVSDEWTSIARRYWTEAGVSRRIDLRLGKAVATLDQLLAEGAGATFDFAFIDADKKNYANYYERVLKLLKPGGVVAVDNVLWSGKVADPADESDTTRVIRAFNKKLHADRRVSVAMLPIGDGLTLARKRPKERRPVVKRRQRRKVMQRRRVLRPR